MKLSPVVVLSFLPLFVLSARAQTAPASPPPASSGQYATSSSSSGAQQYGSSHAAGAVQADTVPPQTYGRLGIDAHVGVNGIGGDVAYKLASHFNLRLGAQYFRYTGSFREEGADINATMRIGGGRAMLDWFPFHNGLHISPMIVFLDQTDIRATVLVPPGQTISLDNGDYRSSQADPLHGSASIGVGKTSPGLTIGYGNIVPRVGGGHFTFPVELGFYYVGQPTLKVAFSGSACDPSEPEPLGCQPVQQDAGFQHDLAAFIRRNNNNLSYASFLPVLSFGVGYSF